MLGSHNQSCEMSFPVDVLTKFKVNVADFFVTAASEIRYDRWKRSKNVQGFVGGPR